MPPMTPIRMTGIGTSSPLPSINGLRTLSLSPTAMFQIRNMIAAYVASVAKTELALLWQIRRVRSV
jgi:hypothetical protein